MKQKARIAGSPAELRAFLTETVRKSAFKLRPILLSEQDQWAIRQGALSHLSNGFFHVAGIQHRETSEQHLIFYQPQSALTGLALFRHGRDVHLLIQARVEPGLPNVAQYGPTIQSTAANYLQVHGGKTATHADLFRSFNPIATPLGNNKQFDLGKRYLQKNKTHSYLELHEQIATEENMIWVPLSVLAAVLRDDNFINPDLRSLLSGIDWDLFVHDVAPTGTKDEASLHEVSVDEASATEGSVDDVRTPNLLGKDEWKMIPLEQLRGWEVTDRGIVDVSESGIWVEMFHTTCRHREVDTWSQPLLCSANRGLVVLLVRHVEGRYEFLISLETEFGISGQRAVLPSQLIYPGENRDHMANVGEQGTLLAEVLLADEGGRFFQNQSLYQVVLVEDEINISPRQRWVSAGTLKSILKSSCRASIQLRCIASLVLPLLNPCAFSQ